MKGHDFFFYVKQRLVVDQRVFRYIDIICVTVFEFCRDDHIYSNNNYISTLKTNIIMHGPYHGSVKKGSKSRSLLGLSLRFRRVARIACTFKQTLIEWIRPSTAVILYWLYLYVLPSFLYDEPYSRVSFPFTVCHTVRRCSCCNVVYGYLLLACSGGEEVTHDVNNSGLAASCTKKAYLYTCMCILIQKMTRLVIQVLKKKLDKIVTYYTESTGS